MRLRRSDPAQPGIRRVRRGRGFSFHGPDGEPLDDRTRERIEALVIPPAWRNVWICPNANGHLQAVGVDDAGRKQYLYHDQWHRAKTEEKHDRVLELARLLPDFRKEVASQLAARGIGRDRVLAGALRILDLGVFRTGGEEYTRSNGTYGLATLQRDHVRLSGDQVRFRYLAKGGTLREVMISDAPLAALVRSLRRAGPDVDRLLAYRDGSQWREVRADEVNLRFRDLTGDDFTAKDLRTWNATVLAAAAFAEHDAPTSRRARQRVRATVMRGCCRGTRQHPRGRPQLLRGPQGRAALRIRPYHPPGTGTHRRQPGRRRRPRRDRTRGHPPARRLTSITSSWTSSARCRSPS